MRRKMLHCLIVIIAVILVTLLILRLLTPLPDIEPRADSMALVSDGSTTLAKAIKPLSAQHEGLTGIHMLSDGQEAFAARALLARTAEQSLDVQYYIWRDDLSGIMLLQELKEAADRGVRVRLLLDDNGMSGLDMPLAALALHEHIEVRLFNPFVVRSPKWLGYGTDFFRLNRRMHNKSFTADGEATIVGGRNVGDEYFAAQDGGLFYDLDVLAIGEVVSEVSADFDRYWSSESSYPVGKILPQATDDQIADLETQAENTKAKPDAARYREALAESEFVESVTAGSLRFEWARVDLLSDNPAKALGKATDDQMLTEKLGEAMGTPQNEVGIIAGYFVPTDAGVAAFTQLAEEGVEVSILTNSYAATDVAFVHSGYAPHRKTLLRAGVNLFELRPASGTERKKSFGVSRSGSGGTIIRGSTLHAKVFTVDRNRLFIGSFNFDPRSFNLNTEMGLVIHSSVLASAVQDSFDAEILETAWQLSLSNGGQMGWRQGDVETSDEPDTTLASRTFTTVVGWLPVEWLL